MPIEMVCPQCKKLLRVPDEAAGRQVRCPACQAIAEAPMAVAEIVPELPFGAHPGDNDNAFRSPAEFPPEPYQPKSLGDDAAIRLLLPVGRSLWAIAAGYLGLFSVLICPAPVALLVSLIAIWDIRTHPEKHGMGRAIFGLVMGLLGSLVIAFILLTAAVRWSGVR